MTIERQYRRTLRLFPRAWRDENEDALVDTLLEHSQGRSRRSRGLDHADLLRTALVLQWRAFSMSTVRAEASASVALAGLAGLAAMTTASLGLIARLWLTGSGLRGGGLVPAEMVVATALFSMWPLAFLVAATRRTRASATVAAAATGLFAVAYFARSSRAFNFVSLGHLFLYISFPLVVAVALGVAASVDHKVDRRWIAVAGAVAVPLTVVVATNLNRVWAPPQPYASPVFAIVASIVVVSVPVILTIGILEPRVFLAGALLLAPIGAGGIGQLIESLTLHEPRPGQAVAGTALALAVAAGSLLPATGLLAAGLVVGLRQTRQANTRQQPSP